MDIAVRNYLGTLNIGDDVIVSRIIESALSVSGIKDSREVTINDKKENVPIKEDEKGEYRTLEDIPGDLSMARADSIAERLPHFYMTWNSQTAISSILKIHRKDDGRD